MTPSGKRSWTTPRDNNLGLHRIENRAGLSISVLPNGCIFAIEHRREDGTTMINQLLGSPVDGGIARLYLRIGGAAPFLIQAAGPGAKGRFGAAGDRFVWEGETSGLRHRVTLSLHPRDAAWLWCLEVTNIGEAARTIDAILIQDIGLGDRGFLMNNEAYASQYIDHHIARHPRYGPVVMSRQNLPQGGRNPWVAHGCLDGASGFATDGMQLFGPAFRDRDGFGFAFGTSLPSKRLQHELACAAIQSAPLTLPPAPARHGGSLASMITITPRPRATATSRGSTRWHGLTMSPPPTLPRRAGPELWCRMRRSAAAEPIGVDGLARRYPDRLHEERAEENLLSFFTPDPPHNRHVVLRDKERLVTRRHGTLLRSGQMMLPDEATLCATCWMHGVFAAQLTIGNTSFHKLFSVSRDPYNITRASGLRMLIDAGDGWRLLTVPSAFEMGLSDCRWIYRFCGRTITVRAIASGEDPAMQWRVTVDGEPCRFLVFGHLVLGERELDCDGLIEVDTQSKRFSLRPGPDSIWGQHYPNAVYHLVTSTPEAVEAIGGDELLYADGQPRHGAYVALRTRPVREFCFAVVGSMTDPEAAEQLAAKYRAGIDDQNLLAPARRYWEGITRNLRISGGDAGGAAFDTLFPWLAHNAMIHLTVPHGLEQYTGGAWGTRDVCQGPVEFLLALEHDEPVKEILRIVFAQQYEAQGDWPQWFMLEPYSIIQDRVSHGDVIVWPLKALNDYIEATGDFGFLDEKPSHGGARTHLSGRHTKIRSPCM